MIFPIQAGLTQRKRFFMAGWLVAAGAFLGACDSILPEAPAEEQLLAGPIDGLSDSQLATHLQGDGQFARIFGPADGLGPLFVAPSCESCHVGDGKGHPVTTLTRFGRFENAVFSPMISRGGPQLQHRSIPGYPAETVPSEATGVTQLMPPAVTGLGYLEAVSDQTLLDLADPTDANGDGISGAVRWVERPSFIVPGPDRVTRDGLYVGKFGKKASAMNLLHQTAGAYSQDMGITTELIPEDLYNRETGEGTGDNVLDPEVPSDELNNVVFYVRTLKAPPRRDETTAEVMEGERVFEAVGCAACHVPELRTADSDIAVLSQVAFFPYTDLLLHDMGPGLDDGYTEGTALTSEWRTAPLWGIGLAADSQGGRPAYLHDGRAGTLRQAVALHGGESAASRARFERLSEKEQEALIGFLESL
jgi:CxxC motif-containing protein (DUF1111 family)